MFKFKKNGTNTIFSDKDSVLAFGSLLDKHINDIAIYRWNMYLCDVTFLFERMCRDGLKFPFKVKHIRCLGDNVFVGDYDNNQIKFILEFGENINYISVMLSDDIVMKYSVKRTGNISREVKHVSTKTKINNDKYYIRKNSVSSATMEIVCFNDILSLNIFRPGSEFIVGEDRIYMVNNENELVKYLKSDNLSFDIFKIYNEVCKYIDNVEIYPLIEIKVKNNSDTFDVLRVKYGKLSKLSWHRKGKNISVNQAGDWNYIKKNLSVSSNNDGITYTKKVSSKDELNVSPIADYDDALNEINDAKRRIRRRNS